MIVDPWEDAFIEECKMIRSDLLQNDLNIEGEFASEEKMRDEWNWTEILYSNKRCS